MGHSMAMTLDTYGHVMDEARGAEKVPAEDAIRAARAADVSGMCPHDGEAVEVSLEIARGY